MACLSHLTMDHASTLGLKEVSPGCARSAVSDSLDERNTTKNLPGDATGCRCKRADKCWWCFYEFNRQ